MTMEKQMKEIRDLRKKKFEDYKYRSELFEKIAGYIECDQVKRSRYKLTKFFMKIINKNRRATLLSDDPNKKLSDITGIRTIHVGDYVLDLYEFDYLKHNIKKKYWKHCSKEYDKARNLIYQQNVEFQKSLYEDQCKSKECLE